MDTKINLNGSKQLSLNNKKYICPKCSNTMSHVIVKHDDINLITDSCSCCGYCKEYTDKENKSSVIFEGEVSLNE